MEDRTTTVTISLEEYVLLKEKANKLDWMVTSLVSIDEKLNSLNNHFLWLEDEVKKDG